MFSSNGDDSFRAYLAAGTESLDEILAAGSPFISMMDHLDSFLTTHVSGSNVLPDDLVIHSMLINVMTSFRIGMTGHARGVFPMLRTALETACYALIMSKDETTILRI